MAEEVERPDGLAGAPDGFERLWTPHRMVYIHGENKPTSDAAPRLPVLPDPGRGATADGLIVHRGEYAYAVLNLYPVLAGAPAGLPLPSRRRLHRPDRRRDGRGRPG